MSKKHLFVVLAGLIILAVLIFIYLKKNEISQICFEKNCFWAELAKTPAERAKGLMFKESLEQNNGMLFIFEAENIYPFWMKNTLIPLDIIWLNEKREIVFIAKNVQPCKNENPADDGVNCPNINPSNSAKYVLEINAGLSEKFNLKIGNKASFK